jgi:alkaline phosphatase D
VSPPIPSPALVLIINCFCSASFDVDTTDRNAPTIKIEAIINGNSVKEFIVQGEPVTLSANNALGRQLASGITGLLDRLGLNPLRWL